MKKNIKRTLFTAFFLLTVGISIVFTCAYLTSRSEPVSFSFNVPTAGIDISETLNENIKNNVRIENTGSVDSFIRATVIFTWQNDKGEILAEIPKENVDYSISWNNSTAWIKGSDGFYYYSSVVPGKENDTTYFTDYLFTACTPLKSAPVDGYKLNVEILSQSFHSYPETEIESSWPVDVNGDKIIKVD